jgi:hypothetical protein
MLLENIQALSLRDLLDLLVSTHARMRDLTRQKETKITVMRDMKKDVQLIQSAILEKKSVKSVAPIM